MNFYKRYPGDYLRDTMHLSPLEHGVYALLLDTYYGTDSPLPAEIERLCRIVHATTETECAAVVEVADRYFPVGQDGLRHNARADKEIEAARPRIEAARENGSRGGRPPKPSGNPVGNPDETQQEPSGEPSVVSGIWLDSKTQQAREKAELAHRFQLFWQIYPRRVAKSDAARAWVRLAPDEQLTERICAAVAAASRSEQWQRDKGSFIPYPATYLNGRRWEDEATNVVQIAQPKKVAL